MSRIALADLSALATRALVASGASPSMALAAARTLVDADAQGLGTHGVARLSVYCDHLRTGRVDGAASPRIAREKGATCLVDAGGGLAFEAVAMAVGQAIKRARDFGIAFAGVTNSHHFGHAGFHLEPVAQAGYVGLAFSNTPAAITAWGGKRALYGTNPVAAIFPRDVHGEDADKLPIVVDLALTEVSRGKILLAAKEGKPIPEGWALDSEGRPTTDPKVALTGSMFPVGGAKGAALALMVELLSVALTGAAFGFENDSYFEPGNKPRIGHTFIAIDPDALAGHEVYEARTEALVAAMLGDAGVRIPGARRFAARAAARAQGVEVPDAILAQLRQLAST